MYILASERPQNCNFGFALEGDIHMCIKCKFSKVNTSYPKDEMDCEKTLAICNALCCCDLFEEDC